MNAELLKFETSPSVSCLLLVVGYLLVSILYKQQTTNNKQPN